MFRRPIKEINAEFPAQERHLDSVQRVVREACIAAGMRRKQMTSVQLAIEEGVTNILRHAYLHEKGMLRVRIVIYRKLIVFSLIDTGRSFQPDATGRLDLNKLVETGRRGGLGFFMIQKIMDSVEYITSGGFNELRMTKRISAEPSGAPGLWRRMFTLRAKFSFWTFSIVCLIVVSAFWYIRTNTVNELYAHLDGTAEALANTIADQASGYVTNRRSDVEFDRLVVSYQKSNPFLRLIAITDTANMVLAHSEDIHKIRKPYVPPYPIPAGSLGQARRIDGAGEQLNYLMVPLSWGERRLGTIHLLYSTELIDSRLGQAAGRSWMLTSVLLVFGVIGIYLLSSYFVTPIVRIVQRVRRFSSGELETELPLDGAAEFLEISHAFNEMMTRVSRDRKTVIEREKMAKEIELVSQIQKTLLPRNLPQLPGLEVDAFYRAASMVSGDLYDVFPVSENRCCLAVADVSGKGVPASMVMSMLRTVIRIFADGCESPRDTLITVNDYLSNNMPPGMFITVLMAVFDASDSTLRFVSAGHNPLLHLHQGTQLVSRVNPSGMPLGMPTTLGRSFGESLQEVELRLQPGDLVLLYTDGITEATSRGGEQYGLDRLADLVLREAGRDSAERLQDVSGGIVNEIDTFSGFSKQNDDITFILARVPVEKPRSRPETTDDTAALSVEKVSDNPETQRD
ncbi:MAG: SpoIIE family protein phosphatase [Candidatus Zixiibacteriota bacterium]|nr:MAG: SpoIIE family protein phosphatase [candidate division Zixibacteria bacterium]